MSYGSNQGNYQGGQQGNYNGQQNSQQGPPSQQYGQGQGNQYGGQPGGQQQGGGYGGGGNGGGNGGGGASLPPGFDKDRPYSSRIAIAGDFEMRFTKYKGMKLKDLANDPEALLFLDWLRSKPDFYGVARDFVTIFFHRPEVAALLDAAIQAKRANAAQRNGGGGGYGGGQPQGGPAQQGGYGQAPSGGASY